MKFIECINVTIGQLTVHNDSSKLDSAVSYEKKLCLRWRLCVDHPHMSAGPGLAALHRASPAGWLLRCSVLASLPCLRVVGRLRRSGCRAENTKNGFKFLILSQISEKKCSTANCGRSAHCVKVFRGSRERKIRWESRKRRRRKKE